MSPTVPPTLRRAAVVLAYLIAAVFPAVFTADAVVTAFAIPAGLGLGLLLGGMFVAAMVLTGAALTQRREYLALFGIPVITCAAIVVSQTILLARGGPDGPPAAVRAVLLACVGLLGLFWAVEYLLYRPFRMRSQRGRRAFVDLVALARHHARAGDLLATDPRPGVTEPRRWVLCSARHGGVVISRVCRDLDALVPGDHGSTQTRHADVERVELIPHLSAAFADYGLLPVRLEAGKSTARTDASMFIPPPAPPLRRHLLDLYIRGRGGDGVVSTATLVDLLDQLRGAHVTAHVHPL